MRRNTFTVEQAKVEKKSIDMLHHDAKKEEEEKYFQQHRLISSLREKRKRDEFKSKYIYIFFLKAAFYLR